MLVLSRKKNERIIIADGLIEILVTEIHSDKVRIAIKAPADVSIHREEVFAAIKRQETAREASA